MGYCWLMKIKLITYCGLKTLYAHQAPKPDPLSFVVLKVVAQEHKLDDLSRTFDIRPIAICNFCMFYLLLFILLVCLSEHDISSIVI